MPSEIIQAITEISLRKAKQVLENDGVIILPTDTNYNLICNAHSKIAIDRIFEIKGRPQDKPLSFFFHNPNDWLKYGFSENNKNLEKVVKHFWPGPLNIILRKTINVPDCILNGGDTVALGCISNSVWQKVISYFSCPITLTSANKSGQANNILVTREIAWEQVGDGVEMFFVDDSERKTTKSSTIIDFTGNNFTIVRAGDITANDISEVIYG